ncbi:hypothetical protein DFH94DRAFT_741354 [Russula ochroleuca]|uniref:Oxidoreductase-like domain-containing protein n=1 Tax=Russula ochroleuca TaxID=152965 RepID=A0A9P5MW86_9AGAM|nr:hypothetical protein DFH94DRAFT_741354 [Russula ochroleuca]
MSGHGVGTIHSFLKHAAHTIKAPQRSYTQPSSPIKHFRRGGRNLSERFQRIEKTFRTTHDLSQTTTDALRPLTPVPPAPLPQGSTVTTFRGLVVPEVPKAPEPDECCMSGCAVCVHDLYQEYLDDYHSSVAAVRISLTDMKVPEEEWPETIRPGSEKRMSLPASGLSLSAFQEMERALKARREAQAKS